MTRHLKSRPDEDKMPLATRKLPDSTGVWDEEEIEAVTKVLRGPAESLMIGPHVAEFEAKVAALFEKQKTGLPNADQVMTRGILVSMNHGFDDDDIGYIVEGIEGFIAEQGR